MQYVKHFIGLPTGFHKVYSYPYGGTYIHALLVSSKPLLKAVNSFNFFSKKNSIS